MSVFNKCEFVKSQLKEHGDLHTSVFYNEDKEEDATSCVVHVKDSKLENALRGTGHSGGLYGAISSFRIIRDGVPESDIVINTEKCGAKTTKGTWLDMVQAYKLKEVGCHIDEVHLHGADDAATHLHVSCPKSSNDVLEAVVRTILDGFDVGRHFCKQSFGWREE